VPLGVAVAGSAGPLRRSGCAAELVRIRSKIVRMRMEASGSGTAKVTPPGTTCSACVASVPIVPLTRGKL